LAVPQSRGADANRSPVLWDSWKIERQAQAGGSIGGRVEGDDFRRKPEIGSRGAAGGRSFDENRGLAPEASAGRRSSRCKPEADAPAGQRMQQTAQAVSSPQA